MEPHRFQDALAEFAAVEGRTIVDVGCGEGDLTRALSRRGATVIGLEVDPKRLDRARAATPVGGETYSAGDARHLPLDDASADVVIFFNSLHHVPMEGQAAALVEAARVLRPGGVVYISEPLAEGPNFELCQPIDDETEVRGHAYRVIQAADRHGLEQTAERIYVNTPTYPDFESYRDRMTARHPVGARRFGPLDKEMRERFRSLGRQTEAGWVFDQPFRVSILRKRPG